MDFWGTPIQQARRGTSEKQYLVPYPSPIGNTFLGLRVQDDAFRAAGHQPRGLPPKEPAALVWGKEAKYFTKEVQKMLRAVVDAAGEDLQVIYTTVKVKEQHPPPRLRGKVGMGGDLVAAMGLPKVQNLGMLDADGYRDLLTRVAVVIG